MIDLLENEKFAAPEIVQALHGMFYNIPINLSCTDDCSILFQGSLMLYKLYAYVIWILFHRDIPLGICFMWRANEPEIINKSWWCIFGECGVRWRRPHALISRFLLPYFISFIICTIAERSLGHKNLYSWCKSTPFPVSITRAPSWWWIELIVTRFWCGRR